MATIIQKHGGSDISRKRISKDNAASYSYRIFGVTSDIEAMVAMDAYKAATVSVNGISLNFDEIKLKHIECDIYDADVSYVHPEQQENEEEQNNDAPQLSFDTTGGRTHITHSYETLRAYGADKDKHSQAIGVEKSTKGQVKINGTDVVIPSLKLSVSAKIAQPSDPFSFGRTMARQTGKVNDSPWNGFAKWELLFLGGKLTGKKREKWTLDYEFDCDEEITAADNFRIGNLGPIVKEGHAHLWVEWKQVVKAATSEGDVMGTDPAAVFIELIHRQFSMSVLGL